MTTQQFIEKAIEGGWDADKWRGGHVGWAEVLLDPEAWKAVGKMEGWKNNMLGWCDSCDAPLGGWREKMHGMIDALAEGISIEGCLKTL